MSRNGRGRGVKLLLPLFVGLAVLVLASPSVTSKTNTHTQTLDLWPHKGPSSDRIDTKRSVLSQLESKLTPDAFDVLYSGESSIAYPHVRHAERRGIPVDTLPVDNDSYQHYWVYFTDKCVDLNDEEAKEAALNGVVQSMHPRAFMSRLKTHNPNIHQVHARQPEESVTVHRARFDPWHQALRSWGFGTPELSPAEGEKELTLHEIFHGISNGHLGATPHEANEPRFPVVEFRSVFKATHGVDPIHLLTPHDMHVCGEYIQTVKNVLALHGEVDEEYNDANNKVVRSHHHGTSKFLNAVSVRVSIGDEKTLTALASLPFVETLDVVRSYTRPFDEENEVAAVGVEDATTAEDDDEIAEVTATTDAGDKGDDENGETATEEQGATEAGEVTEEKDGTGAHTRSEREVEVQGDLSYGDSKSQLKFVRATEMHKMDLSGYMVLVMVCDSGFNTDLWQLPHGEQLISQNDFVNNDPYVTNQEGDDPREWEHGTHTLSIIGAAAPDQLYGSAFGANYMLAKTEDTVNEYVGEETNFMMAIEWAADEGVSVISASLGYSRWYTFSELTGRRSVLSVAVDHFTLHGISIVISAGNYGEHGMAVPADSYYGLSVGSVDSKGKVSSFSSRGPTFDGRIKPDVNALGEHVTYFTPSGDINHGDGTSYSCPLVAGVVALAIEQNPTWTPRNILDAFTNTASKTRNPDNDYGWGTVDGMEAMAQNEKLEACPQNCNNATGNGQCTSHGNATFCFCSDNYYLSDCSLKKQECASFCHGGSCEKPDEDAPVEECKCTDGDWVNMQCQTPGCHAHTSCKSCTKDSKNKCAWCPHGTECITLVPDQDVPIKECPSGEPPFDQCDSLPEVITESSMDLSGVEETDDNLVNLFCPGNCNKPHGKCVTGDDGDTHCNCESGYYGVSCQLVPAGGVGPLTVESTNEHRVLIWLVFLASVAMAFTAVLAVCYLVGRKASTHSVAESLSRPGDTPMKKGAKGW